MRQNEVNKKDTAAPLMVEWGKPPEPGKIKTIPLQKN